MFSHFWFATVQEVLQADWQEAWHSPQPPLAQLSLRLALFRVLTCVIVYILFSFIGFSVAKLYHKTHSCVNSYFTGRAVFTPKTPPMAPQNRKINPFSQTEGPSAPPIVRHPVRKMIPNTITPQAAPVSRPLRP